MDRLAIVKVPPIYFTNFKLNFKGQPNPLVRLRINDKSEIQMIWIMKLQDPMRGAMYKPLQIPENLLGFLRLRLSLGPLLSTLPCLIDREFPVFYQGSVHQLLEDAKWKTHDVITIQFRITDSGRRKFEAVWLYREDLIQVAFLENSYIESSHVLHHMNNWLVDKAMN